MAKKKEPKKELEHLIKEHEKGDKMDERHHGHHFVMIGMVGIVAVVGIIALLIVSSNTAKTGMAYQPTQNSYDSLSSAEYKTCLINLAALINDCNSDSSTSEDSCNNAPILADICFGESSAMR